MSKKLIALLMATLMLLSLAAACGNQPAETPDPAPSTTPEPAPAPAPGTTPEPAPAEPVKDEKYGGHMVIVNNQTYNSIDPHNGNGAMGPAIWMQHIYETPVARGADGRIFPLLCDFTESDDGLNYTFTMREYYFHNGDKVTIEDVLASIERAALLRSSFNEKAWSHVIEKKIEGDTLTLKLDTLVVDFLWQLSDTYGPCFVIPKEICEQYGAEVIPDQSVLDGAGTGPYTWVDGDPETGVTVQRHEAYVPSEFEGATGLAAPRMAYCDKLTFAINKDDASRTAGLIAGDYDAGFILSQMAPYAEQVGLKVQDLYNQWTHAIFFNLDESNSDSPVYDVNFRKAIRAALNIHEVGMSLYSGDETKMDINASPIVTSSPYYNDILETTEWNLGDKELAKEYLAKANYNGEPIKWIVSSGSGFYRAAMGAIPQLEEIGIKVELQTVDSGSHGALRKDPANGHDIGAWECQKAILNPITQLEFVSGTKEGWWTSDKKTEILSRLASTPTGSEASIQAYKEFCQLAADEVPWIIFPTTISKIYCQPNVELNYQGIFGYYWNSYFAD